MQRSCKHCFGNRFVPSTLRLTDIPALFLLLRPVRCQSCVQRQYRNLIPVVGQVFRGAVWLMLIAFASAIIYANVGGQPWGELPMLQITGSTDSQPVSVSDQPE